MNNNVSCPFRNIGFISTRIAGTDGVSLEVAKWASVLERNGFRCFYFAGELDRDPQSSMLVDEAHFLHPEIEKLTSLCFNHRTREQRVSRRIHELRKHLKDKIGEFVREFEIDLLIPENTLAIPLNIPLGLALTEFIAERGFPTVAHHHDFVWERNRFLVNAVEDYLGFAFPPNIRSIQHVVINSLASQQLSFRRGISNLVIPNVYNFANPPAAGTPDLSSKFRRAIGLGNEDLFVLQPTRMVPRKWIERSVEIVHFIDPDNPVLVISHEAEDEGDAYARRIAEYAQNLGVRLVSVENLVGGKGKHDPSGDRKWVIDDVYRCADLITYPSGYEGFGNAFLEAIYHSKPIVVNRYSIYIADIEPKGFDVLTIDGFVTRETIVQIGRILNDEEQRRKMVEKNYALGRKYFSFEVLERLLLNLIKRLKFQCGE